MGREAVTPFSALRLLLLGGLLAVFWLALGAGEARAADPDKAGSDQGSGLGSSLSLPSPPVVSTAVSSVAAAAVPESAQETAGPTAPVPGAVSAPATQTLITAPAAPIVSAVAAPVTSVVNAVAAPVAPVVNAVAAPVTSVVNAVAAPVTSVVSAVAAPVIPVLNTVAVPVGGVVDSVVPVIDAVTAPVVAAVDVSGPGLTGPAEDGLTNPVLTQPAGSNNNPSTGTAAAMDPTDAATDSSTAVNGVSSGPAESSAAAGTSNAVRLAGTAVRAPHSVQQLPPSDPFQFPVPNNRANLPVPLTSGAGGNTHSTGNGSAGSGQQAADLSHRFILPTTPGGDGSPFSFALPGAPDQDPGYSPD